MMRLTALFAGALIIGAACAGAQEPISFSPEGFVRINGAPSLVIGLYELPEDDAVLQAVADAGFNLVCSKPTTESLDRIQRHGLRAWIPLGGVMALPEGDAAAAEKLAAVIDAHKEHPALLSWEAPDESLWNEWYNPDPWFLHRQVTALRDKIKALGDAESEKAAALTATLERAIDLGHRALWAESEAAFAEVWAALGAENPEPAQNMTAKAKAAIESGNRLTRGWQAIWERDKAHVLWQNHAPRNAVADLRHYNRAVHAAGCDIYPVPFNHCCGHSDLIDTNLTSVGAFTRRMRDGAPGKACWMVLQAFGWRDLREGEPDDAAELERTGRRPNFKETRFMAYDAILNGANAILYWGSFTIEKDSVLWNDILKIAKEMRALEPAIVATPEPAAPVAIAETNSASFDGGQPGLMLRRAGDDYVLIAVNEAITPVAFQVAGLPEVLNGKVLYRLNSDEEHVVEQGGFRDGIANLDVHVYATSRRFEVK